MLLVYVTMGPISMPQPTTANLALQSSQTAKGVLLSTFALPVRLTIASALQLSHASILPLLAMQQTVAVVSITQPIDVRVVLLVTA